MIIFLGTGGRLGNQIFQTAFVEGIRKKNELVLTTEMTEARRLFRGLRRYFNLSGRLVNAITDKILHPLLQDVLVRGRIISGYMELGDKRRFTRGVLPLSYCRGYFQAPATLAASGLSAARIRKGYRESAARTLREAGSRTPLFVHVRRGDLATPGIMGPYLPLLPVGYYRSCIRRLLHEVADPHFFLVGDDPEWCEKEFADLRNKTVVRRSAPEDLALMTLCAGGVASNSSFAWCGAYLSKRTAPIYAPRYWLGWSQREWHPRAAKREAFRFVEVPDDAKLEAVR
jgi:hypothetical protein